MNKKRVTAVILSAMMCMQIFTGCGAKNNAAAVEGGAGQTATESAQGAAGTVTEENAQTAEENVQGTADQDGTEESMTGNDAAERADSTEVSVPEDGEYTVEVTLEGGTGESYCEGWSGICDDHMEQYALRLHDRERGEISQ